jgi:hypothetical protein
MDERLRFVARLLEGEQMTALCAEFGISRKTGYKIYDRYKDCGVTGLSHRSRRPCKQVVDREPAEAVQKGRVSALRFRRFFAGSEARSAGVHAMAREHYFTLCWTPAAAGLELGS